MSWRDDEAFVAWLESADGFGFIPPESGWGSVVKLMHNAWLASKAYWLDAAEVAVDDVDPLRKDSYQFRVAATEAM
jgi:hypothetical protein